MVHFQTSYALRTTMLEYTNRDKFSGSFPFVPPPPSLVGAYYLHPPDARAIFLHNDLLCNGACSVTGGCITYWGGGGGHKRKRSNFRYTKSL